MRGFILGVLLTLIVIFGGAYLALQFGAVPANADAKPGGLELWAAGTSLRATLQREAPKGPNPVPLTDENLAEGARLYGRACVVCHGGPVGDAAASPVARGEYPRPPQFATEDAEDDPEGDTYWQLLPGLRLTGMP